MFPDDGTAEAWFAKNRWPDGPRRPRCGNGDIQVNGPEKGRPYRCRAGGRRVRFSVREGTVMEASDPGYRVWAIAVYPCLTGLEGVSGMKLHHDLDLTRKSAWHLARRIREARRQDGSGAFVGPVEADGIYVGGLERNRREDRKPKPVVAVSENRSPLSTGYMASGTGHGRSPFGPS